MNFQSVHSKPFDEAKERVRKAYELMLAKKRMIDDLPPPGSSIYRYFLDPKKNPKSYSQQVESIESLTYEDVFGKPSYSIHEYDDSVNKQPLKFTEMKKKLEMFNKMITIDKEQELKYVISEIRR
jgi:hypothetical protein